MNTLNLPSPIAAYFAAEHDVRALADCFSAQAVMKDDGHTYSGIAAIQAFMAKASAQYGAISLPISLAQEQDEQVVRAQVSGNFPGSPIVLSYRFRLAGDRITSLEVTA